MSPNYTLNASICLMVGSTIFARRDELLALGPQIHSPMHDFERAQAALTAAVDAHRLLETSVLPVAAEAAATQAVLVDVLRAAWLVLPSAGSLTRAKSRAQIAAERAAIFRYGSVSTGKPGADKLLECGQDVVRFLNGGSELARAWPVENAVAVHDAVAAFAPAHSAWVTRSGEISASLRVLRAALRDWQVALGVLRDTTRNLMMGRGEPGRYTALFRYKKPAARKVEVEAEPPPSPPPTPPEGGGSV